MYSVKSYNKCSKCSLSTLTPAQNRFVTRLLPCHRVSPEIRCLIVSSRFRCYGNRRRLCLRLCLRRPMCLLLRLRRWRATHIRLLPGVLGRTAFCRRTCAVRPCAVLYVLRGYACQHGCRQLLSYLPRTHWHGATHFYLESGSCRCVS